MYNFEKLASRFLTERVEGVRKVGIFPGAFKPPHFGHYVTALDAANSCDDLYIYLSSKSRELSTHNKISGPEKPDSERYSNLFKTDKFSNNLLGVQCATCARPKLAGSMKKASASSIRAAISLKDKNTIIKNIPDGVDGDLIFNILMQSNNVDSEDYGYVTVEQSYEIWTLYKDQLIRNTNIDVDRLHLIVSEVSPVKDTYDLVSELNESAEAGDISVHLYVGE